MLLFGYLWHWNNLELFLWCPKEKIIQIQFQSEAHVLELQPIFKRVWNLAHFELKDKSRHHLFVGQGLSPFAELQQWQE